MTLPPRTPPHKDQREDPRPRHGPWWYTQRDIVRRWIEVALVDAPSGWALKTDLFDEASGPQHPMQDLPAHLRPLGMDIDRSIAAASHLRMDGLRANPLCLTADVRRLPLRTGSLSAILSLSTLDHLDSPAEIQMALGELSRSLGPKGRILLTLDNPHNPEVWLRRVLPGAIVRRLRADTFALGISLTLQEGSRRLAQAGLTVERAGYLCHAPRYPSIRLLDWLKARHLQGAIRRVLPMILALEGLSSTPLRSWSGHYCVWIAHKPASDST